MKDIGNTHRKKTVLHILEPEPKGEIGGVDMHLFEFLKSQKNNDEFSHIIFINQNDEYRKMLEDEGIELLFFDKKKGYYRHICQLASWISNNKIDLINSHGYDANYIIFFILKFLYKRKSRPPVIMTCQGWVRTTWQLRVKTFLDIYTYRIADALIVVGDHMQNIRSTYPHKVIKCIPNGVLPLKIKKKLDVRSKLGVSNTTKLVACVGRLSKEKRMDIYLRACKKILNHLKGDIKFLVVGSGREKNRLKELVKELELVDHVIFTGLILDRNEFANLINDIDFLMLTSDTEGSPRAIIEAMSSSKAIVATNVGSVNRLVIPGENGYLAPAGDPKSLANFAIELIENERKKIEFGKRSYELYKSNFTMEHQQNSLNKFYNELLASYAEEQ